MKLTEVESSMIRAVGYDEDDCELEVWFNSGKIYRYEDVPSEEYEGLINSDSKGRYMRSNIIDMYSDYQVKRRR
ncbi:MAG: KTSC domain-containing protein [Desulfobacterales bacterium]|nr:KTSC domain-containing protein [Desulfobacterales bacterium]